MRMPAPQGPSKSSERSARNAAYHSPGPAGERLRIVCCPAAEHSRPLDGTSPFSKHEVPAPPTHAVPFFYDPVLGDPQGSPGRGRPGCRHHCGQECRADEPMPCRHPVVSPALLVGFEVDVVWIAYYSRRGKAVFFFLQLVGISVPSFVFLTFNRTGLNVARSEGTLWSFDHEVGRIIKRVVSRDLL